MTSPSPPPFTPERLNQSLTALYTTVASMSGHTLIPSSTRVAATPAPITASDMTWLRTRKSAQAAELVQNLPFIQSDVAYLTTPIDYHSESGGLGVRAAINPWGMDDVLTGEDEVPLTMQREGMGVIVVLDVKTGLAKLWSQRYISSRPNCTVHSQDDGDRCPLLCRFRDEVPVRPVLELLDEWRRNYLELKWFFTGPGGEVEYVGGEARGEEDPEEELHEKMRDCYRSHGWPDAFRRDECGERLQRLRQRHFEDSATDDNDDS